MLQKKLVKLNIILLVVIIGQLKVSESTSKVIQLNRTIKTKSYDVRFFIGNLKMFKEAIVSRIYWSNFDSFSSLKILPDVDLNDYVIKLTVDIIFSPKSRLTLDTSLNYACIHSVKRRTLTVTKFKLLNINGFDVNVRPFEFKVQNERYKSANFYFSSLKLVGMNQNSDGSLNLINN